VAVEPANVSDDAPIGRTISHAQICVTAKLKKAAPTLYVEISNWKKTQMKMIQS